jgi:lysozyme
MLKPGFIDLSHWNIVPSSLVPARESGIVGVIHKLTEGTGYLDDKVAARWHLAKEAGLKWGLYHFIRPPSSSIDDQVDFFLTQAIEVADDFTAFALDWEDEGVSADDAVRFMQGVEQVLERSPILYSGHVLKQQPDERLQRYRLWLAQYTNAAQPDLPPGWSRWWGWQYTDQGSSEECPGVEAPIDLNAYDGTAQQLAADWAGVAYDEGWLSS